MMRVNTKEKDSCFEIIEEMEKKILELEQQGYSCEYYKARIIEVKGIEGNLILERDFDRTPYGYNFKLGLGRALEKRYESMIKILEKDKDSLHIDKEKDKVLELLLEEAKENLNYDIDIKKLEDYIQRIILYFSCVIKKDYIMPLAELTYQIIKVEYNQRFTTNMLYTIRPYNGMLIKAHPLYKNICECLNMDLHKYGIDKKDRYFDGYLIEEIVKKDNKNFISLDERLEHLKSEKLNNKTRQESLKNEDGTLECSNNKELNCQNNQTLSINKSNIYNNLLKKAMKLIFPKKESSNDNIIITSDKDIKTSPEEETKTYKAALKRVSMYGETTAFSANSDSRIEASALMWFYEIYVKYNKNHPEEAYEILTGKKIPVVDSKTKTEEELPPAFIERKMEEDTIDFDKIMNSYEGEIKTYLLEDKDRLSKQLEIWEYEGKKAIYQNLIKKEEESHQKVLK